MRTNFRIMLAGLACATLLIISGDTLPARAQSLKGIQVPVTYYKLSNGLKVVLSPEHSAPLSTVVVYYNIGFRLEPRDRTAFAYLFEQFNVSGLKESRQDGIYPPWRGQRRYPQRLEYVVGQFDNSKLKPAIGAAFGGWKKGAEPIRNILTINARRTLDVIDRPGAPQSTIYLGMPAIAPSDKDFIKFTVLDSLLGSSFGSRITSNIRENKGYTYSPSSAVWNRFKTGYWYENADVTTESTGNSIKEILNEIERLRKEPPTETELQGIKNYLTRIYVLNNSMRAGVIGQLDNVSYNELSGDYLATYVSNISAVTPADVSEMANKFLRTEVMTIIAVGDKSKITDQLRPTRFLKLQFRVKR